MHNPHLSVEDNTKQGVTVRGEEGADGCVFFVVPEQKTGRFCRESTRKILLNEIKRTRFGDKNRRENSPWDDKNRTGFLRYYGRKNEKPGQFFAPAFANL